MINLLLDGSYYIKYSYFTLLLLRGPGAIFVLRGLSALDSRGLRFCSLRTGAIGPPAAPIVRPPGPAAAVPARSLVGRERHEAPAGLEQQRLHVLLKSFEAIGFPEEI